MIKSQKVVAAITLDDGIYAAAGSSNKCFELRNQPPTSPYSFVLTRLPDCAATTSAVWGCVYPNVCDDTVQDTEIVVAFSAVTNDELIFDGVRYHKVAQPNLKPTWNYPLRVFQVKSGEKFRIDLSRYATDPEGQKLTFSLTSNVGVALRDFILEGRAPVVDALSSSEIGISVSDGVNTIQVVLTLLITP